MSNRRLDVAARLDQRSATRPTLPRIARIAIRMLAIAWLVYWWVWLQGAQHSFLEVDAQAYWRFDLGQLYRSVHLGDQGAFLYSPAVALLFAPFGLLPYPVFYGLLAAVNMVALVYLAGFELAALLLFAVPVSNEIARGNIHLLLGVAIVVGFRYPAAWAWVLLTKVTPGIGLLWFAFRREWRRLGIAVVTTAAIVAVLFFIVPQLWTDWSAMLLGGAGDTRPNAVARFPVIFRIAASVLLLYIGARRNRPAIVPVAALIALPAIWVNSLSMLVAVIPLLRRGSAAPDSTGT
jgi:hypothetical protein